MPNWDLANDASQTMGLAIWEANACDLPAIAGYGGSSTDTVA